MVYLEPYNYTNHLFNSSYRPTFTLMGSQNQTDCYHNDKYIVWFWVE